MRVGKEYRKFKKAKSLIDYYFPLFKIVTCKKCGNGYTREFMLSIRTDETWWCDSFDYYCKDCFPSKASLIEYVMNYLRYQHLLW